MDSTRVWAEIDLDALAHNLDVIRSRCAPGVRLMLVVKADAYGHGAVAVSHHAVRHGVAALGVGTSAEAIELRQSGIRAPILVLGTVVEEELTLCLRHGIQIGLHSSDRCDSLEAHARKLGATAKVHLNIDTGMGRLGVLPLRALDVLARIEAAPHLELGGIMTHVSSMSGTEDASTTTQLELFNGVLLRARSAGLLRGWVHVANSACVFTGLDGPYDTVRPGIAAYGALPSHLPGASELRPVLSLKSQVVFLKDVPMGTPVGYDSTWHSPRPTRIATLPVGYNDGVPWRVGGVGHVLVRGFRAPIIGRVSMDYTTIDVGDVPGLEVGDVATLIGCDGTEEICLEEVAQGAQTIPYEVTCAVGKRVSRVYCGGEEPHEPGSGIRKSIRPRSISLVDSARSKRLAEIQWIRP